MNLYIINNILSDWTSGMVVLAAESKDHARELFVKGVNHAAGIVDYVYGGS
jgi:hypothetical protein